MKLLIAIVQDKDAHLLGDEFAQANIRATRLSTTGGFLRAGNTTFIIGIEEERVEEALGISKENCQSGKDRCISIIIRHPTKANSVLAVPTVKRLY